MLTAFPSNPLRGSTALPGDKSISHRAALFAALAQGESRIDNFLDAGVTRRMLDALTALGVPWELDGSRLRVLGAGPGGLKPPGAPIDCGSSGTTLRILAGAVAAAGVPAVLDGSAGLRKRPMDRIVAPLRAMGVNVDADGGRAPLTFGASARPLRPPGPFRLEVASAQVKTCLLLAGLVSDRPVRIVEPGPSRDHSERMLRAMGVRVEGRTQPGPGGSTLVETRGEPAASLRPLAMSIPGDFSSAAFLIAAAAICEGSEIVLEGVGLNPTRTGFLDALRAMDADIQISNTVERGGEPAGDLRIRHRRLRGTQIAGPLVVRMIDEFPALAVVAAFADGPTIVSDAGELRHKESDRIRALCSQLQAIGVAAEERPDGFVIPGSGPASTSPPPPGGSIMGNNHLLADDRPQGGDRPAGGLIDPAGDHRIAMAFAVAGMGAAGPVQVADAEIIAESFPGFLETLRGLGAQIDF